ncbi:hypothetical protein, partial [Roseicella aerolata]
NGWALACMAPPVGLRPPDGAMQAFLIQIAARSHPDRRAAANVGTPHTSADAFRSPTSTRPSRSKPLPPRRKIEHVRDRDGAPIVRVALPCGASAKTDPKSFAALEAEGVSLNWTFNENGQRSRAYVRVGMLNAAGTRNNLATVARLITQAPPGSVVHYRDGDPLNLRRDNLKVLGAVHDDQGASAQAGEA